MRNEEMPASQLEIEEAPEEGAYRCTPAVALITFWARTAG